MTAQILDGKAALASIKDELRVRVAALKEAGITPGLGTVLVGDDPGSRWYVGAKHKDCAEIGIRSIRKDLPAGTGLDGATRLREVADGSPLAGLIDRSRLHCQP